VYLLTAKLPMNERFLAAVHEAGHVVLGTIFGFSYEYAEVRNKKINGVDYVDGYASNIPHDVAMEGMSKNQKDRYKALWLIGSAGGIAAEIMVGASDRDEQWAMDYKQLEVLMTNGGDIKMPIGAALHFLRDYPAIKKAHAQIRQRLLTKGRIEGSEINTIVAGKITKQEKNKIINEICDHLLKNTPTTEE